MKRIVLSLSVLGSVCTLVAVDLPAAERSSVTTLLDADCRPIPAMLIVPAEKKAVRFDAALTSSWLPCRGGGHTDRIGFALESPTGVVLAHVVRLYRDQPGPEEGDLARLELAPGSYPIRITEGGPHTKAVVSYELIGVKQPTEGILPAGRKAPQ